MLTSLAVAHLRGQGWAGCAGGASGSTCRQRGFYRRHVEQPLAADLKARYPAGGGLVPEPLPGQAKSPHQPRQGDQIINMFVRSHAQSVSMALG